MYKIKNKKCLLTYQFCRRIKSISVIGITVFGLSLTVVNSGIAATLDTAESRDISQTATATLKKNSSDQIQEFIDDVSSFVRGDFFGSITHLIKNASGSVEIPDLGQVFSEIIKGSLPEDAVTANKFENNIRNSYAIRQDIANQSERLGVIEVAQIKTLSKNAQQQSKSTLNKSENSELESSQMSDDSQNSDTSQQILQNISRQLKNNATIGNLQLQEASQARQDRALGLTLTAQAAQELNVVNTRDRQSAIATGNTAISQGSLLVMPGASVFNENPSN